jgi:hypothetical protein
MDTDGTSLRRRWLALAGAAALALGGGAVAGCGEDDVNDAVQSGEEALEDAGNAAEDFDAGEAAEDV